MICEFSFLITIHQVPSFCWGQLLTITWCWYLKSTLINYLYPPNYCIISDFCSIWAKVRLFHNFVIISIKEPTRSIRYIIKELLSPARSNDLIWLSNISINWQYTIGREMRVNHLWKDLYYSESIFQYKTYIHM